MQRLVILLVNTLVNLTGLYFIPHAIAQETDNCYMINSAGTLVNLSRLCTNNYPQTAIQSQVFTTKIKRRYGGTPVIDVTFNGVQQFEMLLDTGATQTTITAAMATQLGLTPTATQTVQVASGEMVMLPVGRVTSIQVGGAMINDAKVLIAPLPLLGQNFFSRYDITIKQHVIEFHVRS